VEPSTLEPCSAPPCAKRPAGDFERFNARRTDSGRPLKLQAYKRRIAIEMARALPVADRDDDETGDGHC
jgi:hypothetical protein